MAAAAALGGVAFGVASTLAVQAALAARARKVDRPQALRPSKEETRRLGRLLLGIDIGGTTISVGVVDDAGAIQGSVQQVLLEEASKTHKPEEVVSRIAELTTAALHSAGAPLSEVRGIGVCCPGLLDVEQGVIRRAANLKGWSSVPLCALVAAELQVDPASVHLENDANAALLAEVWVGAAQGRRDVVLLALGTGIGAGVLSDGRVIRGAKGEGGELGHMILIPDGRAHGGAGVRGILEGYASATALVARALEEGVPGGSSLATARALTCQEIFTQAQLGDAFAQRMVRETARYLAIACINCARGYDPELILFSGGMAQAGDQLLSEVRAQFVEYHWNLAPVTLEICAARSPSHAGLIGAAYAARMSVGAAAS